MWILAAAGRLLGGGWSSFSRAYRSAAKIHGFLLFSGGGRCPLGKLNFGAPHWILGGWVVLQNKVCDHNYTTLANEQGPGDVRRNLLLYPITPLIAPLIAFHPIASLIAPP
eukprot:SAG25_NODE_481_length_7507_cov_80.752160_7_plen_111_part_00